MEAKNTVENLIKDIQDIEKSVNTFKNSSSISTIELDLVLSKLRTIYEAVSQLKEISPSMNEKKPDATPVKLEDEIPEEIKSIDLDEAVQAEETVEEELKSEEEGSQDFELEAESKPEPETIEEPEQTISEAVEKEELGNKETKSAGIIADRLATPKQFRNETLGKTLQGPDLSSKLQSQPLTDIATAIGINDRFHYIKELFNGNSKNFDDTIKVLNSSPNFNEAFNYLSENFNWDMDDPAVQKLLDLTRRKHIINSDE